MTTEEQRRLRAATIALRTLALGASIGTAVVLIGGMAAGQTGTTASTPAQGGRPVPAAGATSASTPTSQLPTDTTTPPNSTTTVLVAGQATRATAAPPVAMTTAKLPPPPVQTTAKPVVTTTAKPPVTTTSATRVGG